MKLPEILEESLLTVRCNGKNCDKSLTCEYALTLVLKPTFHIIPTPNCNYYTPFKPEPFPS